ncbi:MAG: hypothetical protein RL156_327, partial [Bacteroidota bacterium]
MVTLRSLWMFLMRDVALCAGRTLFSHCALGTIGTIGIISTISTFGSISTLRAAESVHVFKSTSATHTADSAQGSNTTQTSDSSQTTSPQVSLFAVPMEHGSWPADSTSVWMTISKRDIQMRYYTGYGDLFELLVPVFPLSLG